MGEGANHREKKERVRVVIWREANGEDGEKRGENLLKK